ncbi:hypothetical protein [Sporosarcina sp. Te-1]|uniref:hypothetical protein n=1 Tax=Sporosarcina sp. Te-1 TaxID=2818390 RepID=UPI001A9EE74C|nr:hypothetical protein [Sporosarcina sp. Te-1]QTD40795.1 hypothetical protein J3U78_18905 [Sporosarcina sp. Te-1]
MGEFDGWELMRGWELVMRDLGGDMRTCVLLMRGNWPGMRDSKGLCADWIVLCADRHPNMTTHTGALNGFDK